MDGGGDSQKSAPSAQNLIADVLVEIFLHCNFSDGQLPSPTTHGSPLILGRVCHTWRQVALSTPQLWSHLNIPKSWNSVGMTEWLKRSASVPLTFRFFDDSYGDVFYRLDVLRRLLANTHRWNHVEVVGNIQLLTLFLRSLRLGAPMLETLDARDFYDWVEEEDFRGHDYIEIDLSKFPKLTSLHLSELAPVVLHHHNIILHKLRSISLGLHRVVGPGIMSMDDYLSLISVCPNLEDASFAITDPSPLHRNYGIIDCKISDLSIWLAREIATAKLNIGAFFDHLCLPDLAKLDIDTQVEATPRISHFPWSHLRSFLLRSRASLVRLRIWTMSPENIQPDEDLLSILHLTPDIQHILLYGLHVSDVVLQAFTHPKSNGGTGSSLCPELVHLSVVDGKFSTTAVKNMILSRPSPKIPFGEIAWDGDGLDGPIRVVDGESGVVATIFPRDKPLEGLRLEDCGMDPSKFVVEDETTLKDMTPSHPCPDKPFEQVIFGDCGLDQSIFAEDDIQRYIAEGLQLRIGTRKS